jgi:hypothetical protein
MITMAARIAVATELRRAIISSGVRALKGFLTTFSSNDKKQMVRRAVLGISKMKPWPKPATSF